MPYVFSYSARQKSYRTAIELEAIKRCELAAHRQMIDGIERVNQEFRTRQGARMQSKMAKSILTNKDREFLLKLADLCDEYKAEFEYTRDDDGIHISLDNRYVFCGFFMFNRGPAELRAAAMLGG